MPNTPDHNRHPDTGICWCSSCQAERISKTKEMMGKSYPLRPIPERDYLTAEEREIATLMLHGHTILAYDDRYANGRHANVDVRILILSLRSARKEIEELRAKVTSIENVFTKITQ